MEWAGNPSFAVVLPGQPPEGSLAERLVEGEEGFFFFSVFFFLFGLFFSQSKEKNRENNSKTFLLFNKKNFLISF